MKKSVFVLSFFISLFLFITCSDDSSTDPQSDNSNTGKLLFQNSNSLTTLLAKTDLVSNPSLTGDTTETYTTSLKLCIGDVWVSQGVVKAGQPDDLDWVRITSVSNNDWKLFEDYTFSEVSLPNGTYKSIKIVFRNVFYRYAELISDPSVTYELFETMGSWSDPCDADDMSWVPANYFGPDGNHSVNDDELFELVSEGEKLGGFEIKAGQTAVVTWRLFAGATEPCVTYLIDANGNREWDCGVDAMDFDCPPEVKYMWDFVVTYQ